MIKYMHQATDTSLMSSWWVSEVRHQEFIGDLVHRSKWEVEANEALVLVQLHDKPLLGDVVRQCLPAVELSKQI